VATGIENSVFPSISVLTVSNEQYSIYL
jgi:hypothetical protein